MSTHYPAPYADSADGNLSPSRRRIARGLVTLAACAALAAGVWGAFSSLSSGAPAANVGEPVRIDGGSMVVESVTPEHMAPMKMGKFAASGMSMASTGMDMAPEGYRRFTAQVSLASEERQALSYSPRSFTVTGSRMREATPIRSQLGSGEIPAGGTVSGTLVFQVPEDAASLALGLDGRRSVGLDPGPAQDHGHDSGSAAEGHHEH